MKIHKRGMRVFLLGFLALALMVAPVFAVTVKAASAISEEAPYESADEAREYIQGLNLGSEESTEELDTAVDYVKETVPMYASFWALVPPIVAIVLALITKEVYFSLFVGILTGALFYANFNVEKMISTVFVSGIITKLSDSWNVGILIFLVILGILVSLINKVGGSAAYGQWAERKIKSRRGAILSTFGLGAVIFVDDYFNCLTVGSVMRPVTDKFKISRAKLAYIIDATAAPVCILAPISSWAAAVTGVVEGYDGLSLFMRSMGYNFYAILTLVMIVVMAMLKFDFGPMKRHENNAMKGDLYTTEARPYADAQTEVVNSKGKVFDLILPILVLIVCCVCGMVYTGGFFNGVNFIEAFANCDASVGLVYGSFVAMVFTFFLYVPRKLLTFKEFSSSLTEGFKSMVPAILILTFAWTLSGMTKDLLGADIYVATLVKGSASAFMMFLPALIFVIALGLAFATGTSWGTFGILLPIIVGIMDPGSEGLIIAISACLAGAVCGDHISPISDTTIMASTGAQCDHINHVSTQLPYALTVAAVSFVCFIIAPLLGHWYLALPVAIVLMIAVILVIKFIFGRKEPVTD